LNDDIFISLSQFSDYLKVNSIKCLSNFFFCILPLKPNDSIFLILSFWFLIPYFKKAIDNYSNRHTITYKTYETTRHKQQSTYHWGHSSWPYYHNRTANYHSTKNILEFLYIYSNTNLYVIITLDYLAPVWCTLKSIASCDKRIEELRGLLIRSFCWDPSKSSHSATKIVFS